MSSFRRDDETPGEPFRPSEPSLDLPGIGSAEDPSLWDVVTTAETSELHADRYDFAALPDGSLIVDDDTADSLSPLADALEKHLGPPYRAAATRQDDTLWVVCARKIRLEQLVADGDDLELTSVGSVSTYTVDGADADVSLAPAELTALGDACGAEYAVRAIRLDGDLWEVTADPL